MLPGHKELTGADEGVRSWLPLRGSSGVAPDSLLLNNSRSCCKPMNNTIYSVVLFCQYKMWCFSWNRTTGISGC